MTATFSLITFTFQHLFFGFIYLIVGVTIFFTLTQYEIIKNGEYVKIKYKYSKRVWWSLFIICGPGTWIIYLAEDVVPRIINGLITRFRNKFSQKNSK